MKYRPPSGTKVGGPLRRDRYLCACRQPRGHLALLGRPEPACHCQGRCSKRAAPRILLEVRELLVGHGGDRVLDSVSLSLSEGEGEARRSSETAWAGPHCDACPTECCRVTRVSVNGTGESIKRVEPLEINRLGTAQVPECRRLLPNVRVLDNILIAVRRVSAPPEQVFELFRH